MKSVKKYTLLLLLGILACPLLTQAQQKLRAPAYPLITVDPYFSIWSMGDKLYKNPTMHWTEQPHSLQGIIRVDGKAYYFLGEPISRYDILLPMAKKHGLWHYTTSKPANEWNESSYDISGWETGRGAFTDGENAPNFWNTREIWARRTFQVDDLSGVDLQNLLLNVQHDDDLEVYINGVPAFKRKGVTNPAAMVNINPKALKAIHEGKNILAAHCTNTGGLAYLDVGLVEKLEPRVDIPHAQQTNVQLTATQTKYTFEAGSVELKVAFTAPLLLDQLELVSRPANYISFTVKSTDGQPHEVQIYFSAASNIAVNTTDQKVVWQRLPSRTLDIMRVGTAAQQILGRKGDDVRIDWGYLYLATSDEESVSSRMAASGPSISDFITDGQLNQPDDKDMPRPARSHPLTLATAYDFGSVSEETEKHHVTLAYDQLYSIEYFHQSLQAWWKKDGQSVVEMLEQANQEYEQVMEDVNVFNQKLFEAARAAGGRKYAELVELGYRQSIAAFKLVIGPDGKPLFFNKENFSNGSIGTVDLIYPTSPLFLYYNTDLVKAMMRPIFYYVESGRWDEPFAPHDVGTYPIANGQTYGGDMPVEESGNMLIMTAAVAEVEGNASFAKKHWETLTQWAQYLLQFGMDPKYQLTTDDFAGRTAHNANLSIKAIMGIASYGKMAGMLGKNELAQTYVDTARYMAKKWIKKAKEGDHYKLTFTRSNSWSQKYNLVWDKVFGWDIFLDKVAQRAIDFYLTKQNKYGLPLDSRATYTKSDWITWTATLAGDKATFKKFIAPLYKAYDETKDRVPMTDWYQTTDASQVGFQARSVVGGYFMKMLQVKMQK